MARPARIAAAASPYVAALGTGLLIAMMIATMSLTAFERQWVVFLSGVLAAAVFAFVSHTASSRWVIARRTSQLNAMRGKLAAESKLRAEAEKALARLGAGGKAEGVAIMTDITPAKGLATPGMDLAAPAAGQDQPRAHAGVAARLIAALKNDEFCLYSQAIAPLGAAGEGASFCEVLLRLREEEENLLPPGSFLPIAEEHGLMPQVDRWVVRNVLNAAAVECRGNDPVYFVNVAAATVAEATFAGFVRGELAAHELDGKALCLEFPEADVLANPRTYRDLIAALDGSGCRFAVSGFGRNPGSLNLFKLLGVNYLKLDGGLALGVLRDPAELAMVKKINETAHKAGMQIVAQCVEDEGTRAALQRVGTDFVQGFGIAMPRPMEKALRDPSNDLRREAA